VKYFFTNAVSDTSKDQVLFQIKQILEEHKNDSKKLSDQKVADALAAKGINVARRTVAKYRAQLNIESSYNRQ
ncbi:MAG: RNA polymerase sigma-54 factor, partial [Treponema sp.]|nr:RNA polymerase sigma-54 factor [Treponema sp.]